MVSTRAPSKPCSAKTISAASRIASRLLSPRLFPDSDIDCFLLVFIASSLIHTSLRITWDNTSFEVMDIKQPLDFLDASFDLVNARFLVGVLNRACWPALLAECRRVLIPGRILILSECEMGVSTSPALQRLGGWLTRALFEQERTFSVDGLTVGMVHMLESLLHQAGFVATQKRPFVLDGSSDSALYASSFREFEITYALLRPYL